MNQRNVEALAAAFAGAFFAVQGGALSPEECLQVAEHMVASRGVLVPPSLTWEDCQRIGGDERGGLIPDLLGRIAKGEA